MMKCCVMMTTQSNAIIRVERTIGEQGSRQDMMGLQSLRATAAATGVVATEDCCGPVLARSSMPERLLGSPVNPIGVASAEVAPCDGTSLPFPPLACVRTRRAVTGPVLVCLIGAAADFASPSPDVKIWQRLVYGEQDALISSDGADVPPEVGARLAVGIEGGERLC